MQEGRAKFSSKAALINDQTTRILQRNFDLSLECDRLRASLSAETKNARAFQLEALALQTECDRLQKEVAELRVVRLPPPSPPLAYLKWNLWGCQARRKSLLRLYLANISPNTSSYRMVYIFGGGAPRGGSQGNTKLSRVGENSHLLMAVGVFLLLANSCLNNGMRRVELLQLNECGVSIFCTTILSYNYILCMVMYDESYQNELFNVYSTNLVKHQFILAPKYS